MTKFDVDTAVTAAGEGTFDATVSPDWSIGAQPNGGYVASVVMRALIAAVDDPQRHPRTYTVHFLRPPAPGPVRVHVAAERTGRTVSTMRARLEQDGKTCVVALAAFALSRPESLAFDDTAMPEVAGPGAFPARALDEHAVSLRRRFDNRWVIGEDGGDGTARSAAWLRLAEPQAADTVVVTQYMDAWMPSMFVKADRRGAVHGPSVPTMELTIHFREPLPPDDATPDDHYLGDFRTEVVRDGFLTEDGRLWAPSGRLVAESRQLAILAF